MNRPVSLKTLRGEEPEWIFPWRPRGDASLGKWFALATVTAAFALLVTSVRITVAPVATSSARRASVIHVLDDAVGRELTLRAREEGPFPSRFEPTQSPALAAIEATAMAATRTPPPAYQPTLRPLPPERAEPMTLSRPGRVVWPVPPIPPNPEASPPSHPAPRPTPTLIPLSGIPPSALPGALPAFTGEVSPVMAAEVPRFVLRLSPAGEVLDCVALDANEDDGGLVRWLRALRFAPEPSQPQRWIALGVAFTNPRSVDGTDSR